MNLEFPNPEDILHFTVILLPDEGLYKGGRFLFTVAIDNDYPHSPPKVQCTQKIYHPNIDLDGKVCLNILRKDWRPVLNLNSVVFGIQYLFLEPNPTDPLNKDAANDMSADLRTFTTNVAKSMKGGYVGGETFDHVLANK
jgi:ubiquitin-conjugating enzyme E2 M